MSAEPGEPLKRALAGEDVPGVEVGRPEVWSLALLIVVVFACVGALAYIWEDLELLDRAYEDLKKDLKEQVDQEEVALAMIENQRAKLKILEQVLDEIESKADNNAETLDI